MPPEETIYDLRYNGIDPYTGVSKDKDLTIEATIEEPANKFCLAGGCPDGIRKLGPITLLLWFIILTLIFWIIFYAWKPSIVQQTDQRGNPTGEPDGVKVLVFSAIISLIIIIIIFIVFNCARW